MAAESKITLFLNIQIRPCQIGLLVSKENFYYFQVGKEFSSVSDNVRSAILFPDKIIGIWFP